MRVLLKIKHWQLLIITIGLASINLPGTLMVDLPVLIGVVIYVLWLAAIALQTDIYGFIVKRSIVFLTYLGIASLLLMYFLQANGVLLDYLISVIFVFSVLALISFASYAVSEIDRLFDGTNNPANRLKNFLLLFFFFVGVWIIQPKLNKCYRSKLEE